MKRLFIGLLFSSLLTGNSVAEERDVLVKDAIASLEEGIELLESGVFVGEEIAKNKMMGTSITERVYKNANGEEIKVTLTRVSADGGGGFMAGMNSIAQFGMMQGERVRIGGVTGSAMSQGSENRVILTLDDGTLYIASS